METQQRYTITPLMLMAMGEISVHPVNPEAVVPLYEFAKSWMLLLGYPVVDRGMPEVMLVDNVHPHYRFDQHHVYLATEGWGNREELCVHEIVHSLQGPWNPEYMRSDGTWSRLGYITNQKELEATTIQAVFAFIQSPQGIKLVQKLNQKPGRLDRFISKMIPVWRVFGYSSLLEVTIKASNRDDVKRDFQDVVREVKARVRERRIF